MEPVDNDLGVGQESPGDVSEASVHVHDGVLHFVPVGEGAKIFLNGQGGSVRQDVEHAAIQRVCDDTLTVSYTHLDVYKRQMQDAETIDHELRVFFGVYLDALAQLQVDDVHDLVRDDDPVSYTHLGSR